MNALMTVNSHVLDNQSNERLLVSGFTANKDMACGKRDELDDDVECGKTVSAARVDVGDVLGELVACLLGGKGALSVIDVPERHGEIFRLIKFVFGE